MEVYQSGLNNLRGQFVDIQVEEKEIPHWSIFYNIVQILPITDEQIILVSQNCTALLDLTSKQVLWSILCPAGAAALDIEHNLLALAGYDILLWDLRNGQMVQKFSIGEQENASEIAFSPDGMLLAAALYGHVHVWDIKNRQLLYTTTGEDEEGCSKSIAFSPNGSFLAVGNYEDNKVWLWSAKGGQLIRMMEKHHKAKRIHGLSFSPDSHMLVGGEAGGEPNIDWTLVWEVETGKLLPAFAVQSGLPVFSLSGRLLASAAIKMPRQILKNGTIITSPAMGPTTYPIYIWETGSKQLRFQIEKHLEPIVGLAFTPSEQILISWSNDGTASWWDVETGEARYHLGIWSSIKTSGAFTHDARFLASGTRDGKIRFWETSDAKNRTERLLLHTLHQTNLVTKGVAVSADGSYVAAWEPSRLFPGSLQIWQVRNKKTSVQKIDGPRNQSWISSGTFSHDGTLIGVGCHDKGDEEHAILRIWRIADKKCLFTFREHIDTIRSLAFSPSDKYIASGSEDCTVRIRDLNKRVGGIIELKTELILSGHTQTVTCLTFSPDGKLLATGSQDQTICIWNVKDGQLVYRLEGHTNAITCMAFSADGQRLASGGDDCSIHIWNIKEGQSLSTFQGRREEIVQHVWGLDDTILPSDTQKESIHLWNLPSEMGTYTFEQENIQIISIAFRPKGILAVAGYCSGRAAMWWLERIEELPR